MLKGIIDLTEKAGYQLLEIMGVMDLDDRDCERLEEAIECFLNGFPLWKKMKLKMKKPGGNLFVATVCLHRRFGTSAPSPAVRMNRRNDGMNIPD